MSRHERPDLLLRRTCGIILGMAIVAMLYLARDVFMPLTLAILLAFLLSSAVSWLERRNVHRVAAVLGVSSLVAGAIFLIGMIVGRQVVGFAEELPAYRKNIVAKIESVNGWAGGNVKQAFGWLEDLRKIGQSRSADSQNTESAQPKSPDISANSPVEKTESKQSPQPIPVEVVNDGLQPIQLAGDLLGPLLSPLSLIGLVALFTVFILLERHDLRNRMVVLLGNQRLFATTRILDEAGDKVSRYLRSQLLINVIHGTTVAIGLGLLGVPNALLWGFLGALLRFLPYLGPALATIMPICVSLAVFEGWMQPLAVIGMYVVIELLSNNVLEPWIYGSSTGLSPLGILLSALFWTWLWGTPGLILATPITACITVLGRHFPQFRFLNVLLSDQPPLPPEAVVYQRLLARDLKQAEDAVATFSKEHDVETVYDEVLLPTIRMAEIDRHQGLMNRDEQAAMKQDLKAFVAKAGNDSQRAAHETNTSPPANILCVSAGDDGDALAAELLAQLLRGAGHRVDTLGARTLAGEVAAKFATGDYDLAIISALPPAATLHTRYLCKRLSQISKPGRIAVGYWTADLFVEKLEHKYRQRGAAFVATRLQDLVRWIRQEAPGWASERACRVATAAPDSALRRIDPAATTPA